MTFRQWLLSTVSHLPAIAAYELRRAALAQDGRAAMLSGGVDPHAYREMSINQLAMVGVKARERVQAWLAEQIGKAPAGAA